MKVYTDEDLDGAVKAGIFDQKDVARFRENISRNESPSLVGEERFRLISGFNDIYVVMACCFLLVSSTWLLAQSSQLVASVILIGTSWLLAEYFVRKKNMALPGIVLAFSFLIGVGMCYLVVFGERASNLRWQNAEPFVCLALSLASWLHWRRFKVPITVAAGTASLLFFVALIIGAWSGIDFSGPLNSYLFISIGLGSGIIAFLYAMYWDSLDQTRRRRNSDVAFWLHILSAPLIVHSIYLGLGILSDRHDMLNVLIVIGVFFLITILSLVIDRKAFMVSAIAYVLYAVSELFRQYSSVDMSSAATGVFMGLMLLLLSMFWQDIRRILMPVLPERIQRAVPAAQD